MEAVQNGTVHTLSTGRVTFEIPVEEGPYPTFTVPILAFYYFATEKATAGKAERDWLEELRSSEYLVWTDPEGNEVRPDLERTLEIYEHVEALYLEKKSKSRERRRAAMLASRGSTASTPSS